jgi:hypothetical protein
VTSAMNSNRRALMWAAIGAAGILGYFIAVEPVLDVRNRLAARADTLAERLAVVRRGAGAAERHAQRVSLGRRQYGEVAMPGDPQQRPIEFNRRIAEALREAGVGAHESRTRPGPMARGPLQGAMGEGVQVESLVTEVEFTATPEQVSRVLATLELCPEVAAINRVDLSRAGGTGGAGGAGESRQLSVTLGIETWIAARGGSR